MEDYDATRAGQAIAAFVDELSNWYVRRSRRRFWDGDPAAFGDAAHAAWSRSPSCSRRSRPFVADAIFENLDGSSTACTCATSPRPAPRDVALEDAMAVARETVRLGLAARGHGEVKVRQPLRAAVVVAAGEERAAIERLAATSCARSSTSRSCASSRGRRARLLRGQAELPHARAALRQADAAGRGGGRGARSGARRGGPARRRPRRRSASRATTTSSGADDLTLALQPLEGYQLEREGSHAVALELELDDELRREGLAREIVHAVQNARKARRACRSRTGSSSRSAATRSCSPPRATTRPTSPRRRSPCACPTGGRRRRRGDHRGPPVRIGLRRDERSPVRCDGGRRRTSTAGIEGWAGGRRRSGVHFAASRGAARRVRETHRSRAFRGRAPGVPRSPAKRTPSGPSRLDAGR